MIAGFGDVLNSASIFKIYGPELAAVLVPVFSSVKPAGAFLASLLDSFVLESFGLETLIYLLLGINGIFAATLGCIKLEEEPKDSKKVKND